MTSIQRYASLLIISTLPLLVTGCASQHEQTADWLNAKQLAELLPGNSIRGQYQYEGQYVAFTEYYTPDGAINGKDQYRSYVGTYQIGSGNCFITDYVAESTDEDGCNHYQHLGGNRYRVKSPQGVMTEVEVLTGNHLKE